MRDDLIAQVGAVVDAHRMLPATGPVVVAVSGGVDSVSLLDLVGRLAARCGVEPVVAHLDHGLRAGSVADAELVEELARGRGLRVRIERAEWHEVAAKGSPQERARWLRLEFLERVAREVGSERIAVGHNADDRAEWVLLRVLNGVAADGWGMPVTRGPYVRPLATVSRAEILAYARMRELTWRDDPSNDDLRYARNQVRHVVLPALERDVNPRLRAALVALGEESLRDRRFLEAAAKRLASEGLDPAQGTIEIEAYRAAPEALRARTLAGWLERIGLPPRRRWLRAIDALALGPRKVGEVHLEGGARVRRIGSRLTREGGVGDRERSSRDHGDS